MIHTWRSSYRTSRSGTSRQRGSTMVSRMLRQVGADGKAATLAAGVAVGYALTGAADGTEAQISLYA